MEIETLSYRNLIHDICSTASQYNIRCCIDKMFAPVHGKFLVEEADDAQNGNCGDSSSGKWRQQQTTTWAQVICLRNV